MLSSSNKSSNLRPFSPTRNCSRMLERTQKKLPKRLRAWKMVLLRQRRRLPQRLKMLSLRIQIMPILRKLRLRLITSTSGLKENSNKSRRMLRELRPRLREKKSSLSLRTNWLMLRSKRPTSSKLSNT